MSFSTVKRSKTIFAAFTATVFIGQSLLPSAQLVQAAEWSDLLDTLAAPASQTKESSDSTTASAQDVSANADYTVDTANKVVSVSPVANATSAINNALNYLKNRSDKSTPWTLKFAPGTYTITSMLNGDNLQNVSLVSDPNNRAILAKSSNSSGEYILYTRFAKNIKVSGFEFRGKTSFSNGPTATWGEQGLYFGSCNGVTLDKNRFINFGDSALRITTTNSDPVSGVNSFNSTVTNNFFSNIYQISTTSNDDIHGATANYLFQYNTIEKLHGSVKFASRTKGAKNVKFLNNTINGGDHYALEINNYDDMEFANNKISNIDDYAIEIYNNDRASQQFAWGNNFNIHDNTLENVGKGIHFRPNPYANGYTYTPKDVNISNNTINKMTDGSTQAIYISSGNINGLKILYNKLNQIASKKYIGVTSGSSNVSVYGNTVDGVAYKYTGGPTGVVTTPPAGEPTPTPTPTPDPTVGAPTAPTTLSAQASLSSGKYSVKLSWKDNASNETGQEVWSSTDGTNYTLLTRLGANVTSYTHDAGETPANPTSYKVRAYNGTGFSAYTGAIQVTMPTTLAAPSNVTGQASVASGNYSVKLGWKENSQIETGQEIWVSNDGGSYSLLTRVGANVTAYTHNVGSTAGSSKTYKLREYNSSGYSLFSTPVKVEMSGAVATNPTPTEPTPTPTPSPTPTPISPLAIQSNVVGQATRSSTGAYATKLSWSDNSSSETGQEIWVSNDASQYTLLIRLGANVTSYTHNLGTSPGSYKYYKLRAYNATNYTSFTKECKVAMSTAVASSSP